MKKIVSLITSLLLAAVSVFGLAACGSAEDDKTITIGASPAPHAEILQVVKEVLEEEGYTLEIREFNDYVLPNTATESGELDANYFQHLKYLEDFNEENGTHLVSVADVHYEPMGIYAGKCDSMDALPEGATVTVPNDTTNEARALFLLEAQGLITLKEDAGLDATVLDIVENEKNLKIQEIEAAQLVRSLEDVDIAVINGNYAISGGLQIGDALAAEAADSDMAKTYTNAVVVKEGRENDEKIQALVKAVCSEEVRAFIEEEYQGAVVPQF